MTSAALVPEFICTDSTRSMRFYRDVLGFSVRYDRPSEGFFYLARDAAEIMLVQHNAEAWVEGPLTRPFGHGMHLQILVEDVEAILQSCRNKDVEIYRDLETAWYRAGDSYVGQRQFVCKDPDGYLLRLAEPLGARTEPPSLGRVVA